MASLADVPQPPAGADTPDALKAAHAMDRLLHANVAHVTGGLSPISLGLALADWGWHLASQPANAARLAISAQQHAVEAMAECLSGDCSGPLAQDARFRDPAWHQWPYAPMARAHQAAQHWWQDASRLRGMSAHHAQVVRFFATQWLDMLSPSNNFLANPEVLRRTAERHGANLVEGAFNRLESWRRRQGLEPLTPPEHPYLPGVDLAVTPGRVVHRNHLVELIQYEPTTDEVQAEPVFIVPSWIMKYYILDLSPHNSLVKWLTGQGHTVFILSWRNPDEGDALLSLDDYLGLGVLDPLAAIARQMPDQPVHTCGYCLGGTLLSIAAAALARPGQVEGAEKLPKLAGVTLLAAQTDFSEPGELGVLIDESQVELLEDIMAERGFLTGRQMAETFQFLRSRELVWSTRMREFWLGERLQPNDLMSWNADVTRMPAVMHSQYLRRCQLQNQLAHGQYPVEGRPVSLGDIREPLFCVATELDHVSPWRSVYQLHRLVHTDLTFVLTNGGHNAGIVSEPGHARRRFRQRRMEAGAHWVAPDAWAQGAQPCEGSWWPAWHDWLVQHSRGRVPARPVPQGLEPAPGSYVHVRYHD
ncbi:PHA/PHB synthase family protein [Azohydromonas lata]|uniref:PHA/PHB synthase family protein n=1 Tax=Azohydromonas lata TaxID=45677 RepID=UPI001EE3DCA3|nr:alpha/beta fold hydrolase [Azohydromonas lata]